MRKGILLVACLFLLYGCLPGIAITRQTPTTQGIPVEFRLGNTVEVSEWVDLQKQVCSDLQPATETLPPEIQKDIFKYSCVEPNRHALGETLAKLKPEQIDELCARLSGKNYTAKRDKIPTAAGEMGTAFLFVLIMLSAM